MKCNSYVNKYYWYDKLIWNVCTLNDYNLLENKWTLGAGLICSLICFVALRADGLGCDATKQTPSVWGVLPIAGWSVSVGEVAVNAAGAQPEFFFSFAPVRDFPSGSRRAQQRGGAGERVQTLLNSFQLLLARSYWKICDAQQQRGVDFGPRHSSSSVFPGLFFFLKVVVYLNNLNSLLF